MYDNLVFAQDASGVVWASQAHSVKPILAPGHEFHNLFSGAALLYAVNRDTKAFIEAFIVEIEARGLDELAQHFQQIAANLNVAARVAEEGLSALI